ncbi:hypothetical protein FI667_g9329, partial [Globisporangium splendens]
MLKTVMEKHGFSDENARRSTAHAVRRESSKVPEDEREGSAGDDDQAVQGREETDGGLSVTKLPALVREDVGAEIAEEASLELRACTEPGHYVRGPAAIPILDPQNPECWTFEFQVVLTEEELKSLKFQRRRLEAEQRHLERQQQPQY